MFGFALTEQSYVAHGTKVRLPGPDSCGAPQSFARLSHRNTNADGTPNTGHKYDNKLVVHDLSPAVVKQIHQELDQKWNQDLETIISMVQNYVHPTLVPLLLDYLIIPKELYSGKLSLLKTENKYEAKCYYFDESRLHLAPNPHQATGTVPQGIILSLVDLHERGLWRRHNSVTFATFKFIQLVGRDLILGPDKKSFTTSSRVATYHGPQRAYNLSNDVVFRLVEGRWIHEITSEMKKGTCTIKKTTFYWIIERLHTEILLEDPPMYYCQTGSTGYNNYIYR
jgi:hypothetical protein